MKKYLTLNTIGRITGEISYPEDLDLSSQYSLTFIPTPSNLLLIPIDELISEYYWHFEDEEFKTQVVKPSEFHVWNSTTYEWNELLPNPSYQNVVVVTNIRYLELSFEITETNWPDYPYETEIWVSDTNQIGDAVLTATILGNQYTQILTETKTRYLWLRPKWEGGVGNYSSMITVAASTVVTNDIAENAVSDTSLILGVTSKELTNYDESQPLLSAMLENKAGILSCRFDNFINFNPTAIHTSGNLKVINNIKINRHTYYREGQITFADNSPIVTGTGTNFTNDLVGKILQVAFIYKMEIASVQSATQLTLVDTFPTSGELTAYHIWLTTLAMYDLDIATQELRYVDGQLLTRDQMLGTVINIPMSTAYLYEFLLSWKMERSSSDWAMTATSPHRSMILSQMKR